MFFSLTAIGLCILIFAFVLGRFGWRRGTTAELVTTGGLIVAAFLYGAFARYILIGGLNLILVAASAVVGRVQGRPPGDVIFSPVVYEAASFNPLRLGVNLFSYLFIAILSYIYGNSYVGKPPKPAKSWLGAALGVVNSILILGSLFTLAGAPDLSTLNLNLTIPSLTLQVTGSRDNPLAALPAWLIFALGGVILIALIYRLGKGLPTQTVTRTRTFRVLGIVIAVAVIVTLAILLPKILVQ